MGNCQTTEGETVLVQHPGDGGKVERIYWSVSANKVMCSNPGYYVALVIQPPGVTRYRSSNEGQSVTNYHLNLLRPDDTLHIGHVYRLISCEDVIKDFTMKRSAKFGKLLKGSRVLGGRGSASDDSQMESGSRCVERNHGGRGHWRPALQSIAEV